MRVRWGVWTDPHPRPSYCRRYAEFVHLFNAQRSSHSVIHDGESDFVNRAFNMFATAADAANKTVSGSESMTKVIDFNDLRAIRDRLGIPDSKLRGGVEDRMLVEMIDEADMDGDKCVTRAEFRRILAQMKLIDL